MAETDLEAGDILIREGQRILVYGKGGYVEILP